jgi:amidase
MTWMVLTICGALGIQPSLSRAQAARGKPFEVQEASITDLQNAMAAGRTTSVELVGAYLARIAAYDREGPALNALIRLNPNARVEAQRMDEERRRGRVRGPLHGVPIIVKDNYDTSDLPTSGGSLALANHQTRDDAFVVRKLLDRQALTAAQVYLSLVTADHAPIEAQVVIPN